MSTTIRFAASSSPFELPLELSLFIEVAEVAIVALEVTKVKRNVPRTQPPTPECQSWQWQWQSQWHKLMCAQQQQQQCQTTSTTKGRREANCSGPDKHTIGALSETYVGVIILASTILVNAMMEMATETIRVTAIHCVHTMSSSWRQLKCNCLSFVAIPPIREKNTLGNRSEDTTSDKSEHETIQSNLRFESFKGSRSRAWDCSLDWLNWAKIPMKSPPTVLWCLLLALMIMGEPTIVNVAEAKGVAGLGKAGGDGQGGSDKAGQQVPPEVYNALFWAGLAFLTTLSMPLVLYGLNKLLNMLEQCCGCRRTTTTTTDVRDDPTSADGLCPTSNGTNGDGSRGARANHHGSSNDNNHSKNNRNGGLLADGLSNDSTIGAQRAANLRANQVANFNVDGRSFKQNHDNSSAHYNHHHHNNNAAQYHQSFNHHRSYHGPHQSYNHNHSQNHDNYHHLRYKSRPFDDIDIDNAQQRQTFNSGQNRAPLRSATLGHIRGPIWSKGSPFNVMDQRSSPLVSIGARLDQSLATSTANVNASGNCKLLQHQKTIGKYGISASDQSLDCLSTFPVRHSTQVKPIDEGLNSDSYLNDATIKQQQPAQSNGSSRAPALANLNGNRSIKCVSSEPHTQHIECCGEQQNNRHPLASNHLMALGGDGTSQCLQVQQAASSQCRNHHHRVGIDDGPFHGQASSAYNNSGETINNNSNKKAFNGQQQGYKSSSMRHSKGQQLNTPSVCAITNRMIANHDNGATQQPKLIVCASNSSGNTSLSTSSYTRTSTSGCSSSSSSSWSSSASSSLPTASTLPMSVSMVNTTNELPAVNQIDLNDHLNHDQPSEFERRQQSSHHRRMYQDPLVASGRRIVTQISAASGDTGGPLTIPKRRASRDLLTLDVGALDQCITPLYDS